MINQEEKRLLQQKTISLAASRGEYFVTSLSLINCYFIVTRCLSERIIHSNKLLPSTVDGATPKPPTKRVEEFVIFCTKIKFKYHLFTTKRSSLPFTSPASYRPCLWNSTHWRSAFFGSLRRRDIVPFVGG